MVLEKRPEVAGVDIADARSILGEIQVSSRRYDEAEDHLVSSYESLSVSRGATSLRTCKALNRIIELYEKWEQPEKLDRYRGIWEQPNGCQSKEGNGPPG